MTKKIQKQFNYAVGRYWNGKDGALSVYSYHGETFYGTLEQAENFRNYIQEQETDAPPNTWHIFQLVELPR